MVNPASAVEVRGVERVFPGGVVAVDRVDFAIAAGEFVAVLGPSGCGKSTLLRMIAGLDQPTAGFMHVLGRGSDDHHIGYVFQDAHLLPWRTALSNVVLPLELLRSTPGERLRAAEQALDLVGLGDAMARYPAELSGGMRMRVSLARALVTNPTLLLLDEPFAALDEITRQQLDLQLHELWLQRRMTVVFVTHSINEAAFLAQRAIVLTRRPARLVLDQRLNLPERRTADLRVDPQFTEEMRSLFDALERGQGNGP
ncbi:MAG TPA: ABC transporter ATP-binding protein [Candidatus Binatia bacterium]|jgi:NitT/TauT family transport system ATP-binding protein